MNNYEQLKQILDNAPEEAVFWDGEDYLDEGFCFAGYANGKVFLKSFQTTYKKDPINTGQLRRLSDIKEIVNLKEKVALAQVYTDKIIEELL